MTMNIPSLIRKRNRLHAKLTKHVEKLLNKLLKEQFPEIAKTHKIKLEKATE